MDVWRQRVSEFKFAVTSEQDVNQVKADSIM
jgi:hypothetical protein